MIKINVINEYNDLDFNKLFKKIARIASIDQKVVFKKRVLNVLITNNDSIHEYNLKYRNIDKETDVLSFPSDEKGELGDIIISYDRVKSQALEYGHSELREIGFLMCHGMLHCLGYDHIEKADEEIMFNLQDKILDKAGLKR